MMNRKTTTKVSMLVAAAALAIGCDNNKKDATTELFNAPGEERVSKFVTVQAANGARYDAMLYPHHFEGGYLNSLGRAKVLLMLEDCENCQPITVHLVNAGEGELLNQRKAAVELYLKTAEGPNKLAFHPAAPNLVRFAKTESGQLDGTAGGGSATATPMPMSTQPK